MSPPGYAEAPTVREAVNKILGRYQAAAETSADSYQLSTLLAGLLSQKSKAGTFDLAGQLASGQILLVGDGNLSFSVALCKLPRIDPKTILASTFETIRRVAPGTIANASRLRALGARVMHGVDATDLRRFVGSSKFTTLVFNFPNVASRTPVHGRNPNHHLVRRFLRSAGTTVLGVSTSWDGEVSRDLLSVSTTNSLGAISTLFLVPPEAAEDLERALRSKTPAEPAAVVDVAEESLVDDMQDKSIEFIKDKVSKLSWDEMQELVAGLLRAMGYKTRVSPTGPDRGKDIVASPDGFGFESPRIVVEVKHRSGAMGSNDIRSFLGGRHDADKGLYVSTGGFTRTHFMKPSEPRSRWL